jgi:hypothetical protein
MLPEISIPRLYFMIMDKIRSTRMSKSYGWGPRLRLRRPTSVLVINYTTLVTCIEKSYCPSWNFNLPRSVSADKLTKYFKC